MLVELWPSLAQTKPILVGIAYIQPIPGQMYHLKPANSRPTLAKFATTSAEIAQIWSNTTPEFGEQVAEFEIVDMRSARYWHNSTKLGPARARFGSFRPTLVDVRHNWGLGDFKA